jgi:chemotaxis protein CheD
MNIHGYKYNRVNVIQGDHAVSSDESCVLTTILGSCVATCLHDPVLKIGGLNHFLLPGDSERSGSDPKSYGLNAMELLINDLLKRGAKRNRLQGKLFGGASMIKGLSDIGLKNAKFATEFLHFEGIPCVSKDMGGKKARSLRFWPSSGRVQLKHLVNEPIVRSVMRPKPIVATPSDIELF